MKLSTILACLGLFFVFNSSAQRAKNGTVTISSANQVVNTYTTMSASASAGATSITVANNAMTGGAFGGTALQQGDLILIAQMYGGTVDVNTWYAAPPNNQPYTLPYSWPNNVYTFGQMLSYEQVGKFERAEVLSVSGSNTITLSCGLTNSYISADRVQIVRIPRYDNLTVNGGASIVPTLWNGTTGGLVALEVDGTLTVNAGGSISASEFGYRGGQVDGFFTPGAASTDLTYPDRFPGSPDGAEGSQKGESIYGFLPEYDAIYSRYGRGAIGNGGGGGSFVNAGGGGGSNAEVAPTAYIGTGTPVGYAAAWALDPTATGSSGGGRGGYCLSQNAQNPLTVGPVNASWGGDARKNNGGLGGHPIPYDATRIFFGGGGGAGDQDSGQGGSGGRGGGIVYIVNYGTIAGTGTIEVNGQDGQNSNPNNLALGFNAYRGNDGAGGGGAAGTVYIENATAIPNTLNIAAIGGDGGDQALQVNIGQPMEAGGPGGSGSGGVIRFSAGAPTQTVTSGANGVTTSAHMVNFPPNGATTGATGESNLPAPYYDLIPNDVSICAGQTANPSVTVSGSYTGTLNWYTQQFGGTPIAGQTNQTTYNVSPATTTTYYVGVCPGTFRVPVTVTVTAGPNLVTTDPAPLCAPATADITVPAITAGSDAGTLTYWQDNGATVTQGTPGAVGAGWHYIQLDAGGGCAIVDSVFVTINPQDDPSFTSSDFCETTTNTISGVVTPGGTFTIQSQTGSGGATINASTGILAGFAAGDQITIQYTTSGACPNSSTQVVNVIPSDDASFTSADFCVTSINTISGVVTAGGTFSIQSQTGSGGATINATTGILSGFAAGDQITIQYTTAGTCPNSSTQVVNVIPSDDPSFTSSDFCISTTNTISGVATPGGTFTIQSQTGSGGATINASTGVLSGFAAGDQITILYTTNGTCPNSSTQVVNVNALDDASFTSSDFCASTVNTISGVASPGGTFTIQSQTGSGGASINGTTGVLSGFAAGDQITIEYTTNGTCPNSSTQVVNVLPTDDASFTSFDFCFSTTNTISGVATPGGTFTIQSQTGSGGATINASTGILSGFAAGDQITIEYTTTGACPNSSTQVVNVTNLDNASFISTDFCVSNTNTISGVATAGGTFSIQSQTGSGGATINASTGILSGFAAGDQITILYTTPAGGCQNSSTQTVNVTSLDDASFTSSDFCESTTNAISGIVTAGGTFSIQSQTGSGGATINASTGVLAGFVAGDQVTIQYTTPAGGCQNSSTQVVNVLPYDDASFTSTDFCISTTNTISGVATPGGTYSIQSQTGSGGATINASTGILSGFAAGDQVTIQYTTNGTCPNSSIQVVNVTPLDDASFTSSDFCESTTNTISGVATAGGTFSIQSQTGSGGATINTSTGILSGYAGGDQVTIQYTTPASGCQNSSTQVVNVIPTPDASFTSADFCESTTNTISGVATAGGTFTIQSQTGSGGATINASTGVLAGFAAGDQITIEYTTPAGPCQTSSTQVVNVLSTDDASFTSSDFCENSVNSISGVAIPGGTFTIQSQTGSGGATINASTGVLSGFAAGDQVTIEYTTPAGGCQNSSTQVVNVTPLDDASFTSSDFCETTVNTISGVASPGGVFAIQSQTGSATINASTGVLSGFAAGDQITIEYTTNGTCPNSSTQVVNVIPQDDATFASFDFCASSTNTISGVVTPGGTFSIQSQTGSGGATINASTGILSGFVAGDQVTILYTTNGTCPNTSTQVVNVTNLDDASFASTDFCENTTNTISGVATPGGTFSIQSQTGSGGATINATTGVLSGYVAGDQVTIEYTTPAGGCQNSGTQVVNVNPLDDASFTSTDFCVSDVNTISGVATAGGTFSIQSQTGSATINASTGVLSGFAAGDQITIEYTTPAAGCQNSSTQVVNVTPLDDASFTSSDFCESSVNTVSGIATPGGTFSIQSQTGSGGATINASTGVLSGFAAGDQITILYTTNGACPNTSTQVVNVTTSDDASFTTADFCESAVNIISSIATPGGTFSIQSQTGSATINATTGELSGFVAGDQITIQYTTAAGACQSSSTQIVNVIPNDIGTFSLTPTCDGATAVVSGLAGGVFTFTTTPSDLATIDAVTGTITGGTPGASYSVNYTTNGTCPVTTTETVVVLDQDDASFTLIPTCDGATATISGTTGGTFSFVVAPSDAAVIDAVTGTITGGTYNAFYEVEYATSGACPSSSIETVTVDDCTPTDLIIPTAFTPGADGANDTWEIIDLDLVYPENTVRVYNRWGSLVFEHSSNAANPYNSNQWDGTFKGAQLPVASYYFIIETNDGSGNKFEGTVTIVQ